MSSKRPVRRDGAAEGKPDRKIKVFYDGQCPMSASVIGCVGRSSKCGEFDLRDIHAEKRLPFKREAVQNEIHVVGRDGLVYKGAHGLLKIAGAYRGLTFVEQIGAFPLVRPLLPISYRFVAANLRLLFGPARRLFWLKVIVVLAFCLGLAMSPHLWIGPRSYPMAPLFDSLPEAGHPVDTTMFAALFVLAGVMLVWPRPQRFMAAFLAVIVIFCLLDQTRWQPWVFLYLFLLGTLAQFSWDSDDLEGRNRALNMARLIMVGTYLFSGLQKINPSFMQNDFPWIVSPITKAVPAAAPALHWLGMAAPFIQVAFALGLLTRRLRRISLIAAVAMHVFILGMFGPLGLDWNNIIWPWAAAMAVLDIVLFAGKQDFSWRDIVRGGRHPYHAGVLVVFIALPLLSFVNLWDSYLSAALYSGNITQAEIYINDRGRNSLPDGIKAYIVHTSDDTNVINIQRWAIEDLNVTPYPEARVYKKIAKDICLHLRNPADLVLIVREQRLFFSKPETGYRCSEQ
jgi:predicted DCC family thiol-disulfide oxidoreductase YuxK